MHKGIFGFAFWFCTVLILGGCSQTGGSSPATPIRVAVAASAEPAIAEIAREYESQTGLRIELIKGASGKLHTQILNGAPYDLFISADTSYSERLYRAGISPLPPPPIARGQLALWSRHPFTNEWQAAIRDPATTRIAIANPQTAPYGQAAWQLLEGANLLQTAQSRLIYAESVGQVAMYIQQGAVDAAITSYSTRSILPQQTGHWQLIDDQPNRYNLPLAAALVRRGQADQEANAEKFLQHLLTIKAQKTLTRHGYLPPEVAKN